MLLTYIACFPALASAQGRAQSDPQHAARRLVDSAESRIVVDHFSGSSAANVPRAGVINALEAEDTVDLVSVRLLDAQRGTLDGSPAGYASVGRRLDLAAILRGKVKSNAEGAHITLTLINGRDGKAMGKLSFEAANLPELRAKLQKELWRALEPLLDAATGREPAAAATPTVAAPDDADEEAKPEAPAKPDADSKPPVAISEPEPAPQPEPTPEQEPKSEPKLRQPAARQCVHFELELGGGAQGRNFNYVHEQRGALRGYRANPAPLLRAELGLYPLVSASCRVSGGVAFGYDRLLKVESQLAGRALPTTGFGGHAEFVLRLSLGPLTLQPGLGYSDRHFAINGGFIPDVSYHALRASLRADLVLDPFLIELRGGGHLPLDAGRLDNADWFPNARGIGYDAEARLGVRFVDWLDLLVGARLEFYSFNLHASTDGAYPRGVAQGAYDRYIDGALSLRFRY